MRSWVQDTKNVQILSISTCHILLASANWSQAVVTTATSTGPIISLRKSASFKPVSSLKSCPWNQLEKVSVWPPLSKGWNFYDFHISCRRHRDNWKKAVIKVVRPFFVPQFQWWMSFWTFTMHLLDDSSFKPVFRSDSLTLTTLFCFWSATFRPSHAILYFERRGALKSPKKRFLTDCNAFFQPGYLAVENGPKRDEHFDTKRSPDIARIYGFLVIYSLFSSTIVGQISPWRPEKKRDNKNIRKYLAL